MKYDLGDQKRKVLVHGTTVVEPKIKNYLKLLNDSDRTISLNDRISAQLSDTAHKWGVILIRVEIQELNYSSETAQAMMQEMGMLSAKEELK